MFEKVASMDDIAPGGMIPVKVNDRDIVLCNCQGTIYAVSRRCGHQNAALNLGTLNGFIITCPLHFAQFDVRTGVALFGSCPREYGSKSAMTQIPHDEQETKDISTFLVKVESGEIFVDLVNPISAR